MNEEKIEDAHELCPLKIAVDLGVHLTDALVIFDLAARGLFTLGKDLDGATEFTGASTNKAESGHIAIQPLDEIFRRCDTSSLVQAFIYLPESALASLQADQALLAQNALSLLKTAVRRGEGLLVQDCLSHIPLDAEVVSALLESKFCLEAGWTPIIEALPPSYKERLIEEETSQLLITLLRSAIKYGQTRFFDSLITYGFRLDQRDFVEMLHLASETGRTNAVERLLEMGNSYSLTFPSLLDTPLHCASSRGFDKIVKLLLARGAPVLVLDASQDTPIHLAANHGLIELLQLLLEANSIAVSSHVSNSSEEDEVDAGTDADEEASENSIEIAPVINDALQIENDSHSIPLEVAIRSGKPAIVSVLLAATPRAIVLERPLLQIASRRGNLDIMRLLLEYDGIDRNRKDDDEWFAVERACWMGHLEVVELLLQHGAEAWPPEIEIYDHPFSRLVWSPDRQNVTRIAELLTSPQYRPEKPILDRILLHVAGGDEALIVTLLNAGADKNATDSLGRSVVHLCAFAGNEAGLRVLSLRGANSSTLDKSGDSPIGDAIRLAHHGVVRLLLERGERLASTEAGTALSTMIRHGGKKTSEALRVLLESQEELRGTKALCKCFHAALRRNDEKLVSLLLDYEADKGYMSRRFGSALHECAYYGNIKMARILLDHNGGVNHTLVNSMIGEYYTPLIAAVSWVYKPSSNRSKGDSVSENKKAKKLGKRRVARQTRMVEFLRARDGDISLRGGVHVTMLNAAVTTGEAELVKYIIDKLGFDVDEIDDEGQTVAHFACSVRNTRDDIGALKTLPERLLWTTDKHGRLPLHLACGGQRRSVLQDLLSLQASGDCINQPDEDGWTPLHWACRQWDVLLLHTLIDHGAKTNSRTKDNWTPWDVAVFHDNTDFATALNRQDSEPSDEDLVRKVGAQWSGSLWCDSCRCKIYGALYTCRTCPEYDLCFKCYPRMTSIHDPHHAFKRIEEPDDQFAERKRAAIQEYEEEKEMRDSSGGNAGDGDSVATE